MSQQKRDDLGIDCAQISRANPFYFGFVAALGALSAIVLLRALASATQIFVIIVIALYLAMGINPAVEGLQKRGLSRVTAVISIFAGILAFVIFFIAVVIPPVISQGSALITSAPDLLRDLETHPVIADLNTQFGVIDSLQKRLSEVTSDGALIISAFGGVVGVGKTVLSGAFTAATVLILTLYFIVGLPQATHFTMRFVPATRRDRVSKLTFAIIARVGSFVGSQIVLAFMAAIFILVLSLSLGLPSPFAIAMIVLVCALIPLIGHYIGGSIVTMIALTQSLLFGVIALILYKFYVQIENYVFTPKIMKRALNVPGAVTIISALVGTSLLGLVGALLAVPIAASIILILEEVVFPQTEKN
jgi:predicted PurR-regulated permease PerM